jgi:chorismate mutase
MALDLLNPKVALDLGNIRYTLIRLEDTIIFNLIERAQFPLNRSVYIPGGVSLPGFNGSFLDWLLTEVERTHGIQNVKCPLTVTS